MHNLPACPVVELMPEFGRTVQRFYAANDAAGEPGVSGREARRLKAVEERESERMRALEGLIMKSVAKSEVGRSLQLIIGHAELVTLHSYSIVGGVQHEVADETEERLAGMLASLLHGRDISQIPALVREVYLGRGYGDDWTVETGFAPVPQVPGLPARSLVAAS